MKISKEPVIFYDYFLKMNQNTPLLVLNTTAIYNNTILNQFQTNSSKLTYNVREHSGFI